MMEAVASMEMASGALPRPGCWNRDFVPELKFHDGGARSLSEFRQVCSNKKLKLGESLSWKETSVEPAPVCKVFRRIDEENTPDSFCKVLCTSELEVITIPSRVLPWFYGGCPESINLKMSTACTWIVDLKQQDGNVLMDAGWPEFVKAHDLKVGYLLTFKKLDTKSLQVLIFGYNCCEKVIWCSGYHPSLGQQYESQLY
ncbi:hypothetical protein QYE76_053088 [Lolium multiflorum]|uniref:TF-B3 domain-containing protein n=1 Tax=Lolium multiflorum TaxID=4521 RepID=A0AAD8WJR3_LOLMU|nr:hypothetical protein QYE76_053088 [Lolium multiflorum]